MQSPARWNGKRSLDRSTELEENAGGTASPRMQLDDVRVVPAFVHQALRGEPLTVFGDGSQTRSFCYVADLVVGLYKLGQSDEREPVNIGNPHEMAVLEFAQYIREITGSRAPIHFEPLPSDDPQRRKPDITTARTILGWEPEVGLEAGLRRTIEYFREQLQTAGATLRQ
jgi:dTDP-glucose 4,6-dehydratase